MRTFHLTKPPIQSRTNSYLTATSRAPSKRPSIITSLSNPSEPSLGRFSDTDRAIIHAEPRTIEEQWEDGEYAHAQVNAHSIARGGAVSPTSVPNTSASTGGAYNTPSSRQTGRTGHGHARQSSVRTRAWAPAPPSMLRTASDGADVEVQNDGNEWDVLNPHGTGRGQHEDEVVHARARGMERGRRHSWGVGGEDYRGVRVTGV